MSSISDISMKSIISFSSSFSIGSSNFPNFLGECSSLKISVPRTFSNFSNFSSFSGGKKHEKMLGVSTVFGVSACGESKLLNEESRESFLNLVLTGVTYSFIGF